MKRWMWIGLCIATVQAQAAALPANSPWLNSNLYTQVVKAGERLVAVGDRGSILWSDDSGKNWQQASQKPNPAFESLTQAPTQVLLTDVCFADPSHGWAVGHDATVLATTDGGTSWMVQYSDPLGGEPVGMDEAAGDDASAYVSESDSESEDEEALPVDTSGAPLLGVWCDPQDARHLVTVGGFGYYLETHDGGAKWHKEMAKLQNPDGWNLYAMVNVPNGSGAAFLVGEKGLLFFTADAGGKWERLRGPYAGTFFNVTATGPGNVLVYGLQGSLWLTHDYGKTWIKVNSGTRSGINSGAIRQDGRILLVGNDGVILESGDKGMTFSPLLSQRATLSAILPLDNDMAVLAGTNGIHLVKLK